MENRKREMVWLGLACFFGGMCLGFMVAPIKKGISINAGNNNSVSKGK